MKPLESVDIPVDRDGWAAIVVLNWNGWADTIACLESLRGLDPAAPARLIVCDNGSTDGSADRLAAWGRAAFGAGCVRLDRAQAETSLRPAGAWRMALIDNGANLGFAGGNNVGVRWALGDPGCTHVWLLNNDTEVAPDALAQALGRMAADPAIGLCGSTLIYHHDRGRVQAFGGSSYDPHTGGTRHLGAFEPVARVPDDPAEVESRMACVVGAAMLASRRFLEEVGLPSEDYFLYYEELDWAWRARGRFRMGYAPRSRVWHKEGASIGTAASGGSPLSLYYLYRSRMRFVARHDPAHRAGVRRCCLAEIARMALRGRFGAARAALNGLLGRDRPGLPHRQAARTVATAGAGA